MKYAEENWMQRRVRHPETGNVVRVKNLPPEIRKRYKPSHVKDVKVTTDKNKMVDSFIENNSEERKKTIDSIEGKIKTLDPEMESGTIESLNELHKTLRGINKLDEHLKLNKKNSFEDQLKTKAIEVVYNLDDADVDKLKKHLGK